MSDQREHVKGRDVIPALADIYNKLYLAPGMDGLKEEYEAVALGGEEPRVKSLSHFSGDDEDEMIFEQTPAGEVLAVTLSKREDFEMFLNIMLNKCVIKEIPKTQGASILDGVVNWNKIHDHMDRFVRAEKEKGVTEPDYDAEFSRFTSDKKNFKDALIILSRGPYSAIKAEEAGFSEEEWLELSHTIRRYHECTHFICRRLYPEKIDAIWDELTADAVGIYAALGRYDISLAETFLGIKEGKYTGGRLENYIKDGEDIQKLSRRVHKVLLEFEEVLSGMQDKAPFEVAIFLEEKYDGLSDILKEGESI
ncbi:MAG: hypothetical protein K6G03_10235 [Lachnospiraceae bacterium]|nr:hypothetical protein [Lachnospiraceae bacterium]